MDLADDVAYSVHDVEDGVVAERVDLARLDRPAVWDAVRAWYLPEADDDALDAALAALTEVGQLAGRAVRRVAAQPGRAQEPHQRPDRPVLRGGPGGDVRGGRRARSSATAPTSSCPSRPAVEMAVLKGIAAHYVMQADDRVALMTRQRELVSELVEALLAHAPASLDRAFADDWEAAPDDAARLRVVIDQVASLTDASAVTWHDRLVRQGSGATGGWRA